MISFAWNSLIHKILLAFTKLLTRHSKSPRMLVDALNRVIRLEFCVVLLCEPRHDKTNRVSVRPAKTLISLGICPVWSVFTVRAKDPNFLHADSEDSDQTAQADLSLRRAHMQFCWFCHEAAHMGHVITKPIYAMCEQQRCRSACASAVWSPINKFRASL